MDITQKYLNEQYSIISLKNYAFENEALNHVYYKIGHLCRMQLEFLEHKTKIIIEQKRPDYNLEKATELFIKEIDGMNKYYISKRTLNKA